MNLWFARGPNVEIAYSKYIIVSTTKKADKYMKATFFIALDIVW